MYEGASWGLYLDVGPTGPTAEEGTKARDGVTLFDARPVRIAELSFGYSPRQSRLDEAHVNSLIEVIDRVPPIIVDQSTMTVIDGLHRTEAARRAGHQEVNAVLFAGSSTEALALAIKANVGHGKPLTRDERRAAAGTLLVRVPDRSDRWVAEVCGLSHTTVARVRETVRAKGRAVRTGRDGRDRPIDNAPGQAAVTRALADNPGSSLRRAARLAGVSPNTARRVATNIARQERDNADPIAGAGALGDERRVKPPWEPQPERDPGWWERTAVFPGDLDAHFGELPVAYLSELVDECRRRAHIWLDIAGDLEQKG